jgi:hypothetical protein
VGGREWRAVAVISAFMAAVTRSEGEGNYSQLKRGDLLGASVGGSMAPKEWAASMAQQHGRRRRRRSASVMREEERPGGRRGLKS